MAKRPENIPEGLLNLGVPGKYTGVIKDLEDSLQVHGSGPAIGGSADVKIQAKAETLPEVGTIVNPAPPAENCQDVIDWRTIDRESLRSRSILAEELLTYKSNLNDLMRRAPGKYVLIVGGEMSIFQDLYQAATYARRYRERPVLIKKIAEVEPVHTLGGVLPVRTKAIGGEKH